MYTPTDLIPELSTWVDGEIWTARAPQRFYGIPMGCRMTVARLSDGRLFVHSPIRLEHVKEDLDALGEVAFVVAPSFIHHLYVSAFHDAQVILHYLLASARTEKMSQSICHTVP